MKVRKLGLHQVAFFRAAFESNLDLSGLATRYLGLGIGLPAAKRALQTVQDALVQAAKRRGKHGAAALLRIPRGRLSSKRPFAASHENSPVLQLAPSFDEYRNEIDPGNFYSEAELLDRYEEQFGVGQNQVKVQTPKDRRLLRNARLLEKKLRLINDLTTEVAQPPQLEDRLDGWFDASIASWLAAGGMVTLGDIVTYMNHRGYRWFARVPRLGQKRAAEVTAFLQASNLVAKLHPYAVVPANEYRMQQRNKQVLLSPPGTIVPLERFRSPSQLDGNQGANRMPAERNKLDAHNDLEAIHAWLGLYANKPHTERAYRKEAERLLLWSIYAKHKPLSSLNTVDVGDYVQFLANPAPAAMWMADRRYERFHPAWRPFVKSGLSERSIAYAVQVLSGLCAWLVGQRYLDSNPFEGLPKLNRNDIKPTQRSLSFQQWGMVREYLQAQPKTLSSIRLSFLVLLAYATGLRRSEMTKARIGDLRVRHFAERSVWFLNVVGKGGRQREVPFVRPLMNTLHHSMQARGHQFESILDISPDTPLIASLEDSNRPISENALYALFKDCFSQVSDWVFSRDKEAAAVFKLASTHWMRHTHATHALRRGVGLESVRDNLGHSSIAVSSLYIDTDLEEQHKETEAFVEQAL
jgi:site-specific recombinase XerD